MLETHFDYFVILSNCQIFLKLSKTRKSEVTFEKDLFSDASPSSRRKKSLVDVFKQENTRKLLKNRKYLSWEDNCEPAGHVPTRGLKIAHRGFVNKPLFIKNKEITVFLSLSLARSARHSLSKINSLRIPEVVVDGDKRHFEVTRYRSGLKQRTTSGVYSTI